MTAQPAAEAHITHDPAYETVAPDDFAAMVEVDRYPRRSDAFDGIIARPTITSGIRTTRPISISRHRSISIARRSCRSSASPS
jgi:hypothetical protein